MSPYTKLAKEAIRYFFGHREILSPPAWLPKKMLSKRQGVFVSLHLNNQLRGCIGTIEPTQSNLAEEIIKNALSAGFQDPRFPPLQPEELDDLKISVDLLSQPKRINSLKGLDPKKHGLIVKTADNRSGLLLPNLPGIDSPEEQLKIASQKAGISPEEEKDLLCFLSKRYY